MNNSEDEESPGESSFESLLLKVKPDGRYQWKLILLFMLPLSFTYSIAQRNGIILMTTPDHVCHVPGRDETITIEEWHNITIPWGVTSKGKMKHEECLMYERIEDETNSTIISFISNNTVSCENGWDYDNSNWSELPVSKFDFVCEKGTRVKYMFLCTLIGATVGSLFFSFISDKFGRKPTFFTVLIINVVFGTAIAFSSSFQSLASFVFISSLSYVVMYQAPYIIVQEVCNQKLRYYTTFCFLTIFVLATAYNSLIAWLLGNWKLFLFATHLPSAIFLLYWKFVPESPRWLLSQGKLEECEKVMKLIAETNGIEFTDEMKKLLVKAQEEERKKKVPAKKVLTSRVLTKHLVLCSVILSCAYIIAGGINMNVHMMLGNVLINYFILRSFELPGNFIGYFAAAYLGRKLTVMINMFLASVCVIVASFYVAEQWTSIILCGLTKTFCKATIYAILLYLGELFPTSLRSSAYGIAQVVAIGSIICDPSIIFLGKTNIQLPYFIWFGFGIFAVVISTFLPETLDQPLPQTIKDAMEIGVNQPYCSIIHKWNVDKYKPSQFRDEIQLTASKNGENPNKQTEKILKM